MTNRKAGRNRRILSDKRTGATLSTLSKIYGLSVEGIRQVVLREERRERRGPLVEILSNHAICGLERFCKKNGIPMPKGVDELRKTLVGDWEKEMSSMRQMGPKTLAELESFVRSGLPDR